MKIIKNIFMIMFILLLVMNLSGCKSKSFTNSFNIYYTNGEINTLVSVKYGTNVMDTTSLVGELLREMNTVQKSDDIVVIKKENVLIESYSISNNIAYIYYNQEYSNMDLSRQALYRGALVKTLTQIQTVDYVMLFVNGSPATYSDGTTIGMISASDIIDDGDNNVSNLQWSDLILYYANSKGDKLVKYNFSIAYSRTVSIERVIVEQLIKGPDSSSYNATLPGTLKLLNISVKDGTCYVNLDGSFLTEIVNVTSAIPIYSIVNSLCELSNIDNVQILINGDSKKLYRDTISLDTLFKTNNDIISQE